MARSELNQNNENWVKVSDEEFKEQVRKDREDFENKLVNKRGNNLNNKNTKAYMSNPDVKEFNRVLRKKVFTKIGAPYKWDNCEDLENEIAGFFELCDRTNTIPTIVNLSVWLGCNRDTIYAHANDSNSPFSDIFKNVINFFHGTIESSAIGGGVNPVLYMFLSKNYFGMRDDKNINIAPATNDPTINNQETMSALQKQLEEENVINADYSEK